MNASDDLFYHMPDQVRALRDPWPTLCGRIRGLTPEEEREFRFGRRVSQTGRGFIVGGSLQGGSSSIWSPTGPETYERYLQWRAIDGLEPSDDPGGYDALRRLLESRGKKLLGGRADQPPLDPAPFEPRYGRVYGLLHDILRELPDHHLERKELTALRIGGWGVDAAKASGYDDGCIHLYDFALKGARRTLLGLFLHEFGHTQEVAFRADEKETLKHAHATIVRHGALYGIEYLHSAASRIEYQRFVVTEFLAEMVLAYTACGAAMRAHARAAPGAALEAWRLVYDSLKTAFGGIEYG